MKAIPEHDIGKKIVSSWVIQKRQNEKKKHGLNVKTRDKDDIYTQCNE